MPKWLLFLYRLPSQPSAPRVATWRALKRIDGGYLQDGAFVAKDTPANRDTLANLAHDVRNDGGEANLLEARDVTDEKAFAARVKAAIGA